MTLPMPDSIYVDRLPDGYGQYLGYADGAVIPATEPALRARFPHARLIILTVTGGTLDADGCDIEKGDLPPASGADWAQRRLAAAPHSRPVLYASPEAPGYRMSQVLTELDARGIGRQEVRLLSAHYGWTGPGGPEHICGPSTCGLVPIPMDGTQWSDSFPGAGGFPIDMSALEDDFFGAPAPAQHEEIDVKVTVVRQGSTGQPVRNWQGLLVAHGYGYLLGGKPGGSVEQLAGVDGTFGPATDAATRKFQQDRKLDVTGVAAAAEWSAAITG